MSKALSQNLTNRELKFSYWYITHKLALRRWLAIFLIIASVLIWFYVIFEMTFYAIDYNLEAYNLSRLASGQNSYLDGLETRAPKPLSFSPINILLGDDNRRDFFVEAANPNPNWLAVFNYKFTAPDSGGESKWGFILPGEKKYLMGLGLENAESGLEIADLRWRRINDFERTKNERLRFNITSEEFQGGVAPGDPNSVSFNITNDSAYNYWEVGIQVFLWSGGQLAGVNYITINQLKTGETRKVELNWANRLPRIDSIQVIPDINILDENNIMPQDRPVN